MVSAGDGGSVGEGGAGEETNFSVERVFHFFLGSLTPLGLSHGLGHLGEDLL